MASGEKSSAWGTTGMFGIFFAIILGLSKSLGPSASPAAGPRAAPDSVRAVRQGRAATNPASILVARLALLDKRLEKLSVRRQRVGVLIAIVPDPIDSRGDWVFDANLEAIRHAYERAGFLPDRFWLPWTSDRQRTGSGIGMRHDSVPGVLFFRQGHGDSVQVVLLVGEVPTTGVQVKAFQQALADLDTLVGARDTIRIVGPTFSGSMRSVRNGLNQYRRLTKRRVHVTMFSGDATAITAPDSLNETFHATVHPDSQLAIARHQVTKAMGIDTLVALLVEGSTAYGQATVTRDTLARTNSDLHVLVPLGIGSLRTEYLDAQASQPQNVPGRQAPFEISLRDPAGLAETPQVQSRLTTPALDLELNAIGEVLAHRHRRAVGIFLTDIRDQLFLARELRRRAPGTLLFVHQSNSLFAWPGFAAATEGMVVITSYPLIPGAEEWVGPTAPRPSELLLFPREGAQGIFNATLFQLGADEHVEGYVPVMAGSTRVPAIWVTAVGRDGFVPLGVEFADTSQCYVAVQPIRASDMVRARGCRKGQPTATGFPQPTAPSDPRASFPAATGFLALLLGLLAAAIAGYPLVADDTWKRFRSTARPPKDAAPHVLWASLHSHWHLYSILRGLALMGVVAPLGAVLWAGQPATSLTVAWLLVLGPTAVTLIPHLLGEARLIRSELGNTITFTARDRLVWFGELFFRTFTIVVGLVFGLGLIVFLVWMDGMNGPARQIMAYRLEHVTSGISPLAPIGVGSFGLLFWCSWHVYRSTRLMLVTPLEQWALTASRHDVTYLQKPNDRAGLLQRLREAVTATRVRVFLLAQRRWSMLLLVALLIAGAMLGASAAPSVELYAFRDLHPGERLLDALYRVMIGGLLACVMWGSYRLLSVWTGLRAVLAQIGASPLLGAFERLPDKVAGMARVSLLRKGVDASVDQAAATQWRLLQGVFRQAHDRGAEALARVDERVGPSPGAHGPAVRSEVIFSDATAGMHQDVAAMFEALEFAWSDPGAERKWLKPLEEYVALGVVVYVEWVIDLLRRLSGFLVVTLVSATLLLLSHPTFDVPSVQGFFFVSLVVTIGTLIVVLAQMSSDEVLSRVNGTDPGKVSWDSSFITNMLTFAAVPTFAIVSWIFPPVGAFLFAWVEPLLHSLGR